MKLLAFTCSLLVLTRFASAADWPQWQGPDRTNVSQETGLLKAWPEDGPKKVWVSEDGGLGYAGMAVVGDSLYTLGAQDNQECLIALNVSDGSKKWSTPISEVLSNGWGDGPRSTPTVVDDLVYAFSGTGTLACVSASDGNVVWKAKAGDFGGGKPNWGYCESVLIDGDKVVWTPGGKQGAVVALNRKTGEKIWQSSQYTEGAQYSSIIVAEHGGRRQYIQLVQQDLFGLDAETGDLLWQSDWPGKTAVIPTPIFHEGQVYISSGYGVGCKLVELSESNDVTEVYANQNMKNHHGGVLRLGDHLFGYSDGVGWLCQDFATGEIVWNDKKELGKGCLTYADGRLYLVDERDGQVVLIDASSEGWKERGRFTLSPQSEQRSPKGKIWTHPTIANGRLYLRDQELIVSYDIREVE
ncbi:MAG: PQQ-like beta-propeller repeat protein [Planctomycetaceae bacterium]|nr:PQQ-like beta-propeller repeat protein [Planctomycetales bacterium]MCB9873781.1 PQQ-like beta-propeller repeat protein [Planctomycetaceae bacterium]MCB9939728.1 PQQ-like beta-propeller repeat protein [Planctomycetaceae bacterium]HRX78022.1 PQQ-like beta-propeller repeat protein [Pirellulaceae bacterium]